MYNEINYIGYLLTQNFVKYSHKSTDMVPELLKPGADGGD